MQTKWVVLTACQMVLMTPVLARGAPPATASAIYALPVSNILASALVLGPDGALYGSYVSGDLGATTLFRLVPPADGLGPWAKTDVYSTAVGFGVTPAAFDANGALYGTAKAPTGAHDSQIFQFVPPTGGAGDGVFRILRTAARGDAFGPVLAVDRGTVYGEVSSGRFPASSARVFALSPPAAGTSFWRYAVLHGFDHDIFDGVLLRHVGGRPTLFGVDFTGTLFTLTAPQSPAAAWTYTNLAVTAAATLPLAADRGLNLYGADGNVFRLRPPADGKPAWSRDTLYPATSSGPNVSSPLVEDDHSNLYGLDEPSLGTIFKVTPRDAGGITLPWQRSVVYDFGANHTIYAPLALGRAGTQDVSLYAGVDNVVYRLRIRR